MNLIKGISSPNIEKGNCGKGWQKYMIYTAWFLFRGECSACQYDTQSAGHRGMCRDTEICRDTEGFAETQNNVQGHRGVCRDTEQFPGTQSSVQGHKGVFRDKK